MDIFSFKREAKHAPAVLVTYVFWNWVAKLPLRPLFFEIEQKGERGSKVQAIETVTRLLG